MEETREVRSVGVGRCVEWMVKEYAGKEERKVVRLGVHAVRVLPSMRMQANIPNLMATNTIEILIAVGAVEEVKGTKVELIKTQKS